MEVLNRVVMRVKVDDREFEFSMPYGVSIGQSYDGAFEILQQIVKIGKDTVDSMASKQETNEDAPKAS